jgi:type II secretory pathway component GspD/PulD (secretin)
MKKTKLIFPVLGAMLLAIATAVAQEPPPDAPGNGSDAGSDAGGPPPDAMVLPVATNNPADSVVEPGTTNNPAPAVIEAATNSPAPRVEVTSKFMPPAQAVGTNNPDAIVMNFKNAPLEMVLNYLSDAAGFIIVLDTRVNGNVSVISSHPMTKDEAVDLLNEVLNKNGYAAIRNGRTLTIVEKNDAKTRNIPVKSSNKPEEIPDNAEIVTQIIPVRFVEARQLVSDLTSFVSPQATVVANEAGNSIVITDSQSNIRHLTEIIRAIDNSAEAETEIRVFRLKYASPADVATELTSIFPSSNSSGGNTQSPISFRGGGGFGGGPGGFFQRMMGGGGGSTGSSSSSDRVKKATSVNAVADSRIQAVIVTAPKDLMDQIASMMTDLDVASTRDQKVYVFHMNNGDPQQAVQVLQNMFQTSGTSRSGSSASQNSALMQRAQNAAPSTTTSGSSSSSFGTGNGGSTRGGTLF